MTIENQDTSQRKYNEANSDSWKNTVAEYCIT